MTQRVEAFVVAILSEKNKRPCGTGFVVSDNGFIATAYHVIQTAIGINTTEEITTRVAITVRFPMVGIQNEAVFETNLSSKAADIAILHVNTLPPGVKAAKLGTSINSAGHIFVSSGYRKASGGAVGMVAPPEIEPTKNIYKRIVLRSDQIDRGMSGAPVLDVVTDTVIGMIVSAWYVSEEEQKDRETAFAVPSEAFKSIHPDFPFIDASHIELLSDTETKVSENLPPLRSWNFVGRDKEVQQIVSFLTSGIPRILISGMSGIGKTTLALEVAYECLRCTLYNTIIWVSSENNIVLTYNLLLDTFAQALERDEARRLEPNEKQQILLGILKGKKALIIIDHFETIADPAVSIFLRSLPRNCQIITTSQRIIALPPEEILTLLPFELESTDQLIRNLSQGKRLEKVSDQLVGELHTAVGGLPLAIEWVTGQINSGRQTIDSLLARLQNVQISDIYETLFSWAYANLSDTEAVLLRTIAFFSGSASKLALKMISEIPGEHLELAVEKLMELSLVADNEEFQDAKVRYRLHPLLRNYAINGTEKALKDRLQARYLEYFSNYASSNIPEIIKSKTVDSQTFEARIFDISTVIDWAELDLPNITACAELCIEKQLDKELIILVQNMSYPFYTFGLWNERIRWGQEAARAALRLGQLKSQAWILVNEIGYVFIQQDRFEEARTILLEGLQIAQNQVETLKHNPELLASDAKDQQGFQFTLYLAERYLGILFTRLADFDQAAVHFGRSLAGFKELDRNSIIANQRIEMGELFFQQQKYDQAQDHFQEALSYHEPQQHHKSWVLGWIARAYSGLGDIEFAKGDLVKSRDEFEKSLEYAVRSRSKENIAYAQLRLAQIDEIEITERLQRTIKYASDAQSFFSQMGKQKYCQQLSSLLEVAEPFVKKKTD